MTFRFEQPLTEKQMKQLQRRFGRPYAYDDRTLLYDRMFDLHPEDARDVAEITRQAATFVPYTELEIVTLNDGTQLRATAQGWVRIAPPR